MTSRRLPLIRVVLSFRENSTTFETCHSPWLPTTPSLSKSIRLSGLKQHFHVSKQEKPCKMSSFSSIQRMDALTKSQKPLLNDKRQATSYNISEYYIGKITHDKARQENSCCDGEPEESRS
mmetsp:Transcript_16907/g.41187  ORF Transcript_16907/g.41187 Transcript_16907/m.41187 type:complete len:121 (+) Transcript_16907:807-1169(+)